MATVRVRVPKFKLSKRTGKLRKAGYSTRHVHVPTRKR